MNKKVTEIITRRKIQHVTCMPYQTHSHDKVKRLIRGIISRLHNSSIDVECWITIVNKVA